MVARGVLAVACALSFGPRARSEDGGALRVEMTCEPTGAPGRVPCEVTARVAAGESIAWGDVVILSTPPFSTALRGRIGPHEATTREPQLWRWALALAARQRGAGDVRARVRLVVCAGDASASCDPVEAHVVARVVVGPIDRAE